MKEYSYFDIGANLTHESFEKDFMEVIEEAKQNNVKRICITSTSIEDTKVSLKLLEKDQNFLITTCGIHPHYADTFKESDIEELRKLSKHPSVKAIGETGLDFNRNYSKKENQILCFESQIKVAQEQNLPLFLHQRDAHKDFMDCFNNIDLKVNAVVHCFTGNREEFYKYLDKGFWIGFTGWICDPVRGKHMVDLIANMPLERIMIETDSPYLLPKNIKIKGRRNEPKFIVEVAKKIAKLQNKSLEEITQIFFENSQRFFGL